MKSQKYDSEQNFHHHNPLFVFLSLLPFNTYRTYVYIYLYICISMHTLVTCLVRIPLFVCVCVNKEDFFSSLFLSLSLATLVSLMTIIVDKKEEKTPTKKFYFNVLVHVENSPHMIFLFICISIYGMNEISCSIFLSLCLSFFFLYKKYLITIQRKE